MNETVSNKTAAAKAEVSPPASAGPGAMLGTHPRSVFICSSYRPTIPDKACRDSELEANIDRARRACRIAVALGFLPLAPHLYFTRFLDDNTAHERQTGIRLAMQWLEDASEVWVIGDKVSTGMKAEIKKATELGKNVRRLPEPGRMVELLLKELSEREQDRTGKQTGTRESAEGTVEKSAEEDTQRQEDAAESED